MSERNKLTVSPIEGADELLINGFKISIGLHWDSETIVYTVYRKGALVYTPNSLQEAVKWCED